MIASGLMPRSPVWLRKIPSTVSGSQGSRRGLRPAVRFAFPLGARLNITLRARPCQELFSESFSRPSRGPRGAPPSGLRPFAAASSVLYAPRARRGRETRPHTGCRQLQRGGAEGGVSGGRAASGWRFAPPRMRSAPGAPAHVHRRNRPGGPALARLGPPGHSIRPHTFNYLYINRRIGLASRPEVLPPSSCKRSFPYRWRFLIRLRQTPCEGGVASRKKNGRLRARPPSARAIPSATAPGRFSMSEGFHHFDIDEAKARPPIRMLKHFHRVRSCTCMPNRPWPRS